VNENLHDEDQRIIQEITGRFGAPSFIRRAKQVEVAWSNLVERLEQMRRQQLEMVGLRLGQLSARAGTWEALRGLLRDADLDRLERLHGELQPRLRMPLETTTSGRVLRSALHELAAAMEAFNQRWSNVIAGADLKPVNDVREAYNRYFLLEKECALGSARVAQIGFQRIAPVTLDDLRTRFPVLNIPEINS